MSIFNLSGTSLQGVYGISGSSIKAVYDITGKVIYTAALPENIVNFSTTSSNMSSWKFLKVSDTANMNYSSTKEAELYFDDSKWESVTVPHDWSIYNNFNSNSASTYEGGYLDGGDAWYRINFTIADALKDNKIILYFDGVYMESDVYLNGKKLGSNYHGYNPFWFDITDSVKTDGLNTLAVFVRNHQPSSRWYSGSGIYRPVYLLGVRKDNISASELQVTYPNIETEKDSSVATILNAKIHNDGDEVSKDITVSIRYNNSEVVKSTKTVTLSNGDNDFNTSVSVTSPKLWDIGSPNIYEAVIIIGDNEIASTEFGYRWTKWDVDTGFWINGVNTKIKGVCMHHDLGCIGAEANRSAMERQIDSMINMGANAIRLTHNPGSEMFLDLCMKKGVLVVEELFDHWTVAKNTYDFARFYSEHHNEVIKNTLIRDRNNPAIIMWSLGNEINRTANYSASAVEPIVTELIQSVKTYDTTRPVTMGEDRPNMDSSKVCMNLLDVCGINYNSNDLSVPHGLNKPSYGSETTSALSSRGIYARDDTNYQCASYDNDKVSWGSYAATALKNHMTNAYSGGLFVWTGWDYIGEPTPFNKYPTKSSYFGIVDLAGFPKDIYYMYQSQWTTSPMIHIVPMDWDSWTVGNSVKVFLYSNCESVELFQDGTSLGKKAKSDIGNLYQFEYSVTFAKGTLTAKGYDVSNNTVATDEIKSSSGIPSQLKLSAYKSQVDTTTDDLVFVTCDICDENGIVIPTANTKVSFACEDGSVLGTDNGNAACVENMRSKSKSAFNGKVLCVCKHDGKTGTMTVIATADGLPASSIKITKV